MTRAIYLFDTTHMALWAEDVAVQQGIPAEVVPAPPDRKGARCDLALETFADCVADLSPRLTEAGVEFYPPETLER